MSNLLARPGRLIAGALVVVAMALVFIGATHTFGPPSRTGTQSDRPVSDPRVGVTLYRPGSRETLPELSGLSLDGSQLSTGQFAGQILVLNVWGSWCVPCREEAPDLAEVSAEGASSGVQFIGVDTRDNVDAALAFQRRFGISYPSFDDDSDVLLELAGVVPVNAVPSTIVVDVDGDIAARVIGRVDAATLRGIIGDLRAENGASGGAEGNLS